VSSRSAYECVLRELEEAVITERDAINPDGKDSRHPYLNNFS
jgi:hypothetical protein